METKLKKNPQQYRKNQDVDDEAVHVLLSRSEDRGHFETPRSQIFSARVKHKQNAGERM